MQFCGDISTSSLKVAPSFVLLRFPSIAFFNRTEAVPKVGLWSKRDTQYFMVLTVLSSVIVNALSDAVKTVHFYSHRVKMISIPFSSANAGLKIMSFFVRPIPSLSNIMQTATLNFVISCRLRCGRGHEPVDP